MTSTFSTPHGVTHALARTAATGGKGTRFIAACGASTRSPIFGRLVDCTRCAVKEAKA